MGFCRIEPADPRPWSGALGRILSSEIGGAVRADAAHPEIVVVDVPSSMLRWSLPACGFKNVTIRHVNKRVNGSGRTELDLRSNDSRILSTELNRNSIRLPVKAHALPVSVHDALDALRKGVDVSLDIAYRLFRWTVFCEVFARHGRQYAIGPGSV